MPAALAGNGLNMIGFGAESVLMGGADAAVARDTTALNTNPAGLASSLAPRLDVFSGLARALDVGHADALGNDLSISNRWAPIAGAGHSRPLAEGWVLGAGFFVQGGAGARYDSVRTAFGTQDEMTALTGIAKAALGLGWQASERLSLGASLSAVYAPLGAGGGDAARSVPRGASRGSRGARQSRVLASAGMSKFDIS